MDFWFLSIWREFQIIISWTGLLWPTLIIIIYHFSLQTFHVCYTWICLEDPCILSNICRAIWRGKSLVLTIPLSKAYVYVSLCKIYVLMYFLIIFLLGWVFEMMNMHARTYKMKYLIDLPLVNNKRINAKTRRSLPFGYFI